jgi:hypothetical protein
MLAATINNRRRIGCEFEMTIPRVGTGGGRDVQETLAQVLSANGVPAVARPYSHQPIHRADVAVEYDQSVRGESRYEGIAWYSVEIKTRPLVGIDDWERIVPKALDICRYLGARVNRSCGHHLHVDLPESLADPRHIRSVYNLFHRFEPLIYGIVAPSRRENGYARPMQDRTRYLHGCKTWRCFRRALGDWDRRCGLNLIHLFQREPRIELRYHHGTLDPDKARHWMHFALRMIDHATTRRCQAATKQVSNDRRGLEALRYTIGLRSNPKMYANVDKELRQTGAYMLQRWKQFNEPKISEQTSSNEIDG